MAHKTSQLTLGELCCVCIASPVNGVDTNWLNMYTDSVAGQDLMSLIEETTGRKVKPSKDLPGSICPACLKSAKIALNFKRRLEQSLKCFIGHNEALCSVKGQLVKQEQTFSEGSDTQEFESLTDKEENLNKSDEGPFQCSHCLTTYSIKGTHTCKRRFECSHCLKIFSCKRNLQEHFHTHTGVRPFECSLCSKTCRSKSDLQKHQRTHTGEKPYKCTECSMSYSHGSSLKSHLLRHTGERPFECTHCLKTFSCKGNLQVHLRTHTGDRPYKCTECVKSFTQKSSLNRHLHTHIVE